MYPVAYTTGMVISTTEEMLDICYYYNVIIHLCSCSLKVPQGTKSWKPIHSKYVYGIKNQWTHAAQSDHILASQNIPTVDASCYCSVSCLIHVCTCGYKLMQVPLPGIPRHYVSVQETTPQSCQGRWTGNCQETCKWCVAVSPDKMWLILFSWSVIILQIKQVICEWSRYRDRKHSPACGQPLWTYGLYVRVHIQLHVYLSTLCVHYMYIILPWFCKVTQIHVHM